MHVAIALREVPSHLIANMQLAGGDSPSGAGVPAASHFQYDGLAPCKAVGSKVSNGLQELEIAKRLRVDRKLARGVAVDDFNLRFRLIGCATVARQHSLPRTAHGIVLPTARSLPILRHQRLLGERLESH